MSHGCTGLRRNSTVVYERAQQQQQPTTMHNNTHRVGADIPTPQSDSVPLFDFKARRSGASFGGSGSGRGLLFKDKELLAIQ